MSSINWLTTRTSAGCVVCATELELVDATDALAARPVTVLVHCPKCGFDGSMVLTDGNYLPNFSVPPAAPQSMVPPAALSGKLSIPPLPAVEMHVPRMMQGLPAIAQRLSPVAPEEHRSHPENDIVPHEELGAG